MRPTTWNRAHRTTSGRHIRRGETQDCQRTEAPLERQRGGAWMRSGLVSVFAAALMLLGVPAHASPSAPGPAPDFTLPDHTGATVSLAKYRGKTVVLEWFNPECPFIVHAHEKGPLSPGKAKGLAQSDKVVWLAINSGAPGRQGHGAATNAAAQKKWKMTYPVLFDESGDIGRKYGARTTPHMFVIDPAGKIIYRGALDNAPLGRVEKEKTATNYVEAALTDLAAGRPVKTGETSPYGCSVKYAN